MRRHLGFMAMAIGLGGSMASGQAPSDDPPSPAPPGFPPIILSNLKPGRVAPEILDSPRVRDELKLDAAQSEGLDASAKRFEAEMQVANVGGAADQKAIDAVYERCCSRQAELLRPEQYRRLRQIWIQRRGFMALMDPEIRSKLGLSDGQNGRLDALESRYRANVSAEMRVLNEEHERFITGEGTVRQYVTAKRRYIEAIQTLQAGCHKDCLAVLTAEQTSAWERLIGEPFDFEGPKVAK